MIIARTCTLATGSPSLTSMRRTSDLASGLYVYGTGIPIEAAIASLDSPTQVTLSQNVTVTGAKALQFANAAVGAWHEMNCALIDAEAICEERGDHIQVFERDEADVTRDSYRSIKKRSQTPSGGAKYDIRAYPVEFRPSERRLEKAGLREECDVAIHTPMKFWMDQGINFDEIDMTRSTIHLQGNTYEVRDRGLASQFGDTFAYITFGLFKR